MIETLVIGSFVGKGVVTQAIAETSRGVFNGVSGLMNNEDFYIKYVLEDLDINPKISTINSLMIQIEAKDHISDTVHICLNNLHDIIDKIHKEIIEIEKEIEIDKTKWFRSFRTPNYIKMVDKLKIHKRIMDERLDLLIKMLTL